MLTTLLRRFCGLGALLVLLVLGLAGPARATHLLGGEMSYRYLDANGPAAAPFRYELTVTIYNNSLPGAAQPNPEAVVGIYNRTTGAQIVLTTVNYARIVTQGGTPGLMSIASTSLSQVLLPPTATGCTVTGPQQPFRLQKFVGVVNLPLSFDGYYAVFTRSARNVDVTNLNTGNNNRPLTLYTSMAPALLPNHAPVFSDTAVAVVCQNDTTISLNNAVDADGDRLVYSFGSPYGQFASSGSNLPRLFPPLPLAIGYYAGYSLANPFGTGAGNFALLNASTGVARYGAANQGKYVIAVDVAEYRTINGREVLIGTTRRDLQLVVAQCPSTRAPALAPAVALPRAYTIEEGQALSIPITATQVAGDPLVLTANSALLDGAGGFNATFNGNAGTVAAGSLTGTATATGSGTVVGTFVYNSACGEARATPYDVALTVRDVACGGKTAADVLRITVTRAAGPTAIAGDATACAQTAHAYTANGATATYRWRATGGTVVGSATGPTVQVLWGSAGTGTLVARGVSAYGCLTDSVSLPVTILAAPALAVAGPLSICQGASTTLSVSGSSAYTLTGGGTTQTGPGPFVVAPTQTTTYTITGAANPSGCAGTAQVTVTVLPLPTVVPGAAVAICSGGTAQLGAPAVAGVTYSWSPATGLSNPASANPTVTLANATAGALTVTYTLTATLATGCAATGTVAVTVSPAPVVRAGTAATVCAGQTVTLGAPTQAGFTYAWTPAAGLSSATVAQPVYTAANSTGAPIVVKFRVTGTSPQGCAGRDSVLITVNPLPPQRTITGPGFICDPSQAFTGTYAVAGASATSTYQWAVVGGTITGGQGTGQVTVLFTSGAPSRSLSVVETSAFGCTGTAASNLNILLDQPTITLTTASVDATSNARIILTFSVPNGTNTPNQVQVLRRVAGTGAFAVVGTVAPTATAYTDANAVDASANSYEYQLTVANGCGTVLTTAVAQTVRLQATATAGAGGYRQGSVALRWNPYIGFTVSGYRVYRRLDGAPATLLATVPATTLAYTLPNGALDTSSDGAGFAQNFRVVAFSADATPLLSNSNETLVSFANPLAFYNIITPNGDNRNDRLVIDNVALYPGNSLVIFNRWGREVYATTNYQNTWGDAPDVAPGKYYYLFKLADGSTIKGWVEVVK
ncbi:gliding motility-associated C-terminal domain-containing protein [Hymenobacter sp. PAMC 26628]|uniref:gliding motility-associated C-terminal domain-containing protein n=1 Tax=Hymenobacter sp. PAMC 26628 TaxID=1484118 RepID=UPI000B1E914B|nr:gliding motility-associated C-terminal domain-containing protein [Hymenobacter sp. PAMC 26628]